MSAGFSTHAIRGDFIEDHGTDRGRYAARPRDGDAVNAATPCATAAVLSAGFMRPDHTPDLLKHIDAV